MRRFLLILVLMFVGIAACKKNKGPASVPSAQPDNGVDSLLSMTAVINGVDWKTDSAYSYKIKNSGNDSGVINLMIVATQTKNDTVSTITFNLTDYTGIKDYAIDPPN
jgi:hypothetical protein